MGRCKQDVQLELLKEIDRICEDNGLKYILFGNNALNAYNNHTIKDGSQIVSVAMTRGDADRFCKIVETNPDRYVEGIFNNSRCNDLYISYGDRNTTELPIEQANYNKCKGICVRIYFIKKRKDLNGVRYCEWNKRFNLERKIRDYLNKRVLSPKLWFIKAAKAVLYGMYALTGGGKRFYKQMRNRVFLDKWDEIKDFSIVRVGQSGGVAAEYIYETQKYEVDGIYLNMPKMAEEFFSSFYGEHFSDIEIKRKKLPAKTILSTDVGFDKFQNDHREMLIESRKCREEILWNRFFVKHARDVVTKVWDLVRMTQKQVNFQKYFAENIDRILQLDFEDPDQYLEIYTEVRPVISSLYKYSLMGMTFSIDEKTDALVMKVLEKRRSYNTIRRIQRIKKKQYYI